MNTIDIKENLSLKLAYAIKYHTYYEVEKIQQEIAEYGYTYEEIHTNAINKGY